MDHGICKHTTCFQPILSHMLYHIPPTNKIYKSPRDPPIARSSRLSCSQKCTSVLLTCRSEPCILPLFFQHRLSLRIVKEIDITTALVSSNVIIVLQRFMFQLLYLPSQLQLLSMIMSNLDYDCQCILQLSPTPTLNDERYDTDREFARM